MSLEHYHKKRNFSKTPEPEGKITKHAHHLFVIQKHHASHLHYDFRIELDGVLKSWAVPKGPSLDSTVKRLAMHVEDHPVDYGTFEGIIPKGEYGGGTVMLWDRGHWSSLDDDPQKAYKKGHLRFELNAEKLKGRWDLIRFKDEKHWFLVKFKDKFARPSADYDITEDLDKSVATNQTIDEITQHYQRVWHSNGQDKIKKTGKTKSTPELTTFQACKKELHPCDLPEWFSPALATLVNKPPTGNLWLHEVKFDGYRIMAFRQGSKIVLKSRTNKDWTTSFPTIVKALKKIPFKTLILDGEIVLLDKVGKSDFQLLQNTIAEHPNAPYQYYIFDLLYLDGFDLRERPLLERKAILKELFFYCDKPLQFSDHIINNGKQVFDHSCELSLEGIISKKTSSTYHSKRSNDWLKIKCIKRQEFIIGGFTPPKGQRDFFGALCLGVYNDAKELVYCGNVGTGFTDASLKEIHKKLKERVIATQPFVKKPPASTHYNWTRPELIAEVEFSEWTDEGHLRHPSFKGLRLDKAPPEVIRETDKAITSIEKKSSKPFIISHPEKILYPEDKITKQDIVNYYDSVSELILPYIMERPLTIVRCPDNYKHCFYQRHYNKGIPNGLFSIDDPTTKKHEQYIYLKDKQGLLSLVQLGVLEIHPWGSANANLNKPDRIIFDLDPAPDVTWKTVVKSAFEIRDKLAELNLQSFVKTTGGKGLHVVIPIIPDYDWDKIKQFSRSFVEALEQFKPDCYISTMTKSKRVGKVFIDYLRNQHTATAVGAYSLRSRPHAPVSVPLAWEELSNRASDNQFTIKRVLRRLKKLKTDPWAAFWTMQQSLDLTDFKK